MTFLRHLLTNQINLCILANQKHAIELPKPIMIHDYNREKIGAFSFHRLRLSIKVRFHENLN